MVGSDSHPDSKFSGNSDECRVHPLGAEGQRHPMACNTKRNVWNWGGGAPQRKIGFLFPKEGEGVLGICTQQMFTPHGMSIERGGR